MAPCSLVKSSDLSEVLTATVIGVITEWSCENSSWGSDGTKKGSLEVRHKTRSNNKMGDQAWTVFSRPPVSRFAFRSGPYKKAPPNLWTESARSGGHTWMQGSAATKLSDFWIYSQLFVASRTHVIKREDLEKKRSATVYLLRLKVVTSNFYTCSEAGGDVFLRHFGIYP
jgi:hypothetical protein